MTTKFHALCLSNKINQHVLYMAKRYHVDLNSVEHLTDNYISIGEQKTGLTIDLKQHETTYDGVLAGVYVTCFNRSGHTIEHVNVIGETL